MITNLLIIYIKKIYNNEEGLTHIYIYYNYYCKSISDLLKLDPFYKNNKFNL